MSTFINGHGVEFNGVIATDVTIKNTDIAENTGNGVFIIDSAFTDFAIQNSYLGEVLDGMGMQLFAGNGVDGFHGENSTFTGVAFLDSFFNLNGTVGLGGEGIRFFNSTINSGLVSLDPSMTLTTGFALKGSQVGANVSNGVFFDMVTAEDVTIKGVDIAANGANGVFVGDSTFTDFAIQNSYLGEAPNPMGGTFAGNGTDGFHAEDTTFSGLLFLNSTVTPTASRITAMAVSRSSAARSSKAR